MIIYQLFPRNHTKEGTFPSIILDLPRIKNLGIDCIYLLPIHPVGMIQRKGTLGSPYSIQDYKEIDKSYGTMDNFKQFVDVVHLLGMKIIMDAVVNHTSKDSKFLNEHPSWFYRRGGEITCKVKPHSGLHQSENLSSRVKAWTDVADLDYECTDKANLISEVIDVFRFWLKIGIDGFRCDVACKLPENFWNKCIGTLRVEYPKSYWISESFDLKSLENNNAVLSENILLKYFDVTYDYYLFKLWNNVVMGRVPLEYYLDHLRLQICTQSGGERQLRFIENHDTKRLASFISNKLVELWLTFFTFIPGSLMIYSGIESFDKKTPSLFEKDLIDIENKYFTDLSKILGIKQKVSLCNCDEIYFTNNNPLIVIRRNKETQKGFYGIFCINLEDKVIVDLPNGSYIDTLTKNKYTIHNKKIIENHPDVIILEFTSGRNYHNYKSNLFG